MPVVVSVLVVEANDSAVVTWIKLMIDVSKIIPGNIALFIFPGFTA
jgi:hypothetical protein